LLEALIEEASKLFVPITHSIDRSDGVL
jgi:hypothetical protein